LAQFLPVQRQELLQAGMAAGFGAVFGTPLTGAVFAMEVLVVRRFGLFAVIPCLVAAYVGHWSVGVWGVEHTTYPHITLAEFGLVGVDALMLAKVAAASACFGLASWLFLTCAHGVGAIATRVIAAPWLRPVAGGVVVIALTYMVGTTDYLGLGVSAPAGGVSIVSSFSEQGAHSTSWLLKLVFTAVTVGSGFKGGEVTPLFFVGATLGNTLGVLLHAPIPLFAALGFVAVFGAAANTPISCAIMGLELFGTDAAAYIVLTCLLAHFFSGRKGLYESHTGKTATAEKNESPLPP
jgi:H+/Cl- antiporter ClcA